MKKYKLLFLISLCLLFPTFLSAQWLEQMMYLPDSFSGCAIPRVIIWNQVNDQLYFPWYHTVVTLDCETNEKVQPIRTHNALDRYSFAYNSANNCLYSTTELISSVCTLYAINCQNRQVVTKTPIHFQPNRPSFHSNSLSTNPISNKVYLIINDERHGEDSLFIIDAGVNQIKGSIGINAAYWQTPLFNPNHNVTYIFSPEVIYVLDGITDSLVDTIETYPITQPYPILLDTINDRLYCRGYATGNKILQINCSTNQVIAEIFIDTIFENGCEAAIDPINHKLYISPLLGNGKNIWVIDANRGFVEDSICTEFRLTGVKYCSMNNRLYVTTRGRNYVNWDTILVINPLNHQIVSYIDIGKFEPNLAGNRWNNVVWFLHPLSNKLYISLWSSYLCIIDCETNQIITPKIILGLYSPGGFLWNPLTNRFYCTDKRHAYVHCVDASTNRSLYTRELPIPGYGLSEMAVATQHNKIYVGFPGGIVVLDGVADTVIRVIWFPPGVKSLCYNLTSDKIYGTHPPYTCVINCVNDEIIAVINTSLAAVPYCNPRTNTIYVSRVDGINSPTIIIDGISDTIIATLDSIQGYLAFREIDELVYFSDYEYLNSIAILDGKTNQLIEYLPNLKAYNLVYNPINDRLYSSHGDKSLVLDCITNTVIDTIPIPFVVFHNPINNKLYAYDYYSNLIWVIDGVTNEIIARFDGIGKPIEIPIWNSFQNRTYIYFYHQSRVAVIRDEIPGIEEHSILNTEHITPEIYPNPARSYFTVRLPLNTNHSMIKIFDVSGKLVRSVELNKFESLNESEVRISLKGINPGIYFVELGKEVKKLLIVQ